MGAHQRMPCSRADPMQRRTPAGVRGRGAARRHAAARRAGGAARLRPRRIAQVNANANSAPLRRMQRVGYAFRARVARCGISRAFEGDGTAGEAPREAILALWWHARARAALVFAWHSRGAAARRLRAGR